MNADGVGAVRDGVAAVPTQLGPTRRRLLRCLCDASEPLTVAALSAELGLHHTSVRAHLARLVDAGLVAVESEDRDRVGRPRLLYRATDAAAPLVGSGGGPYEWLATLLAEMTRTGASAREVGREAGRGAFAAVASRVTDGIAGLAREMDERGFHAILRRRPGGAEIELARCPYVAAARRDPATVCDLHLGCAEGYADAAGGLRVSGLDARDPAVAGCVLSVSTVATGRGEQPSGS